MYKRNTYEFKYVTKIYLQIKKLIKKKNEKISLCKGLFYFNFVFILH